MIQNRRVVGVQGVAALVVLVFLALPVHAQTVGDARFELRSRDAVIAGTGLILAGIGKGLLDTRTRELPPPGLDPMDISPGWDRRSIHIPRSGPDDASLGFGIGAFLAPHFLNLTRNSDDRFDSHLRLGRVQGESLLLTAGAVLVLKPVFSRARPFAYVPEDQRPEGYGLEDAFQSFPSGHSALAWSAGTAGMVYLAAEHPDMSQVLNGAVIGGLATCTSLLRVEAGEHFPSDVAAGAVLGSGIGLGVALLHANAEGMDVDGKSLRNGFLGMAVGAVAAFLLTPPTSPWVD